MPCKPGNSYKTRFGYVRLRDRKVDLDSLTAIPPDIAIARPGWNAVMIAQPLLVECLEAWKGESLEMCIELVGEEFAEVGEIVVNSCFRSIGTTAGSGKYKDTCGAVDSTDKYGHYSGYAIDVPTGLFRRACYPVLSIAEIRLAANRAGLTMPFLSAGEWWHFRPKKSLTRRG